jgi:hypothetical protein
MYRQPAEMIEILRGGEKEFTSYIRIQKIEAVTALPLESLVKYPATSAAKTTADKVQIVLSQPQPGQTMEEGAGLSFSFSFSSMYFKPRTNWAQ